MLTLTLKPGEYVDIGDDIRFVFTGGTVNSIHVLVEAPKDQTVYRSEAPPKPSKTSKGKPRNASEGRAGDDLETKIKRIFEAY